MHLGNGAITPECGLVALGIAAAGVGVSLAAERKLGFDQGRARTAGALTAAVFAAQMFNVPILPYSSAHLIGGVLLAWVLGPGLGLICMTVVLSLQAVLLGDGGLLALGANVTNMGLVPAAGVWLVNRLVFGDKPYDGKLSSMAALAATAFAATLAGAGLIALEVALGRGPVQLAGWTTFATSMLTAQALAGALEAAASVGIVLLLDAAHRPAASPIALSRRQALTIATASAVLALASLPQLGLASGEPDGYEAALLALRNAGQALGAIEVVRGAGSVAAAAQSWQDTVTRNVPLPEPLWVVLAVGLAGGCAALCASGARRRTEGSWAHP